jgi:hypothetical protein
MHLQETLDAEAAALAKKAALRKQRAQRILRDALALGADICMDGSWHPEDMRAFQAKLPAYKAALIKRMLEL